MKSRRKSPSKEAARIGVLPALVRTVTCVLLLLCLSACESEPTSREPSVHEQARERARAALGYSGDDDCTHWDGREIRPGNPPFSAKLPPPRIYPLPVHDAPPTISEVTKEPARSVESSDLERTSIVATLDCPLAEHQNVIWCSTFQMAWDKLSSDIIGEPIGVRGAEEIASRLNQGQFDYQNLEARSFYTTAGIVKDGIVDQIQKEMANRFPYQPKPVFGNLDALPEQTRKESIVAYSFLGVEIDFEYPFYVNEHPFKFRDSAGTPTKIKSFLEQAGRGSLKSVSDQVEVLYYRDTDQDGDVDFVVDPSRNTEPYQVVLARMRRRDTLGESVAAAEARISEFEGDPDYEVLRNLKPIDTFIVPDILYKLIHHFAELEGKNLANPAWPGYFFLEAMQMIDFKLSRTGVILRSEARISLFRSGPDPRRQMIEPRHFDFNSPFLIYVKKRGADYSPFFVMWVDNAELMEEFE